MTENTPNKEQESDATYDHVIKYTGLFGGIQGISMLASLVRNKIVAEFLGPDGAAIINIFNNVAKLVNQSTNFGISFSAVKHVAELFDTADTEKVRAFAKTVRTWSLFTGLLGMLICMALSRQISYWSFESYDYTLHFIGLSFMIAMMAVQGGEIAILKGMKQLKKVALVSVFGAVSTLVISAPIYLLMGMEGIVFALVLAFASILAIHIYYTSKVVPWSISLFSSSEYAQGLPMLKLGVGYIIAGIFGQGAEYVIRILIRHFGCLADVGLYNSGYVLAVTYANIVFIAFEADYFPRLSAAQHDVVRQNTTVNQQIEVGLLLMSPILILFVLAMPVIVPLLYSSEFVNAVPMAICASSFMFFKALTLPAAYLALAKGDSKMYMLTELIYDVFIAIAIPLAYKCWGLQGAGWALSAGGLLDFLLIHVIYRYRYKYKFDFSKSALYLLQFICFASTIFLSLYVDGWAKYLGWGALAVSMFLSYRVLSKETNIMSSIKKKLWRK